MLVGGSHFTVLATVIFAVVVLAEGAGAAGSCGDMALEIAMSSKPESGGLSKDGTFISLTGDPYGAYLYCSGAFVSKTGSVRTKRRQPIVRSAVERCIREASKASDFVEIRSDSFEVLCDSEKSSSYFETGPNTTSMNGARPAASYRPATVFRRALVRASVRYYHIRAPYLSNPTPSRASYFHNKIEPTQSRMMDT